MLEIKRREVSHTGFMSKKLLPAIDTVRVLIFYLISLSSIQFEDTSSLSNNDSPTLSVSNAKTTEYRELLSQVIESDT